MLKQSLAKKPVEPAGARRDGRAADRDRSIAASRTLSAFASTRLPSSELEPEEETGARGALDARAAGRLVLDPGRCGRRPDCSVTDGPSASSFEAVVRCSRVRLQIDRAPAACRLTGPSFTTSRTP